MWVVFLGYGLAFYWGAVLIEEGVDNPRLAIVASPRIMVGVVWDAIQQQLLGHDRTGEPWTAGNIVSVFFCVFIGSFYLGNVQPGRICGLIHAK
eukprot:3768953-Amphidinium_carterae.1